MRSHDAPAPWHASSPGISGSRGSSHSRSARLPRAGTASSTTISNRLRIVTTRTNPHTGPGHEPRGLDHFLGATEAEDMLVAISANVNNVDVAAGLLVASGAATFQAGYLGVNNAPASDPADISYGDLP